MGVTKVVKESLEERILKLKKKKDEAEAKITPKKGSIAKKTTISATDIKQATTANELNMMQRRIDNMPEGANKKSYQKLLDRARKRFEKMQADEVDTKTRKQQQAAADKKAKPVTMPEMPFNRGGMSSRKGNFDMRKGGMFAK